MGGKPFQSRLIPHAAAISAQRRRGHTWREIAARLTEEEGCHIDPGNLCRFFARWKRRPHALGAEPEPDPKPERMPVPSRTPPPAVQPPARASAVEEARRLAAESQSRKEAEGAGWEAIHTGGPLSKSRPNP